MDAPPDSPVVLSRSDLRTLAELEEHSSESGSCSGLVCIARAARHTASYAVMDGVLRVVSDTGLLEQPGWSGSPEELSVSADGQRAVIARD